MDAFGEDQTVNAYNQENARNTAELVEAVLSGDRDSFGVLVARHAGSVTAVAYSVCGDFARSEDIGQEAFIEAWKNLATLHDRDKFVAWVCSIARHKAVDAIRANRTPQSTCSIDGISIEPVDTKQLSPEVRMSQRQQQQLVWSILENLPEAYREPMILFYRNEQSTREVAIALGENEATIRQRLKRAREMLREEVSETLRLALCETAPKAAFAAVVMASLPVVSYAAAATTATSAVVAKSGVGSVAAKVATGAALGSAGAVLGSVIGLLGGAFGTWMSWKNCEYESQQKFILREALKYVVALAVFMVVLSALIYARTQGLINNNTLYASLLVGFILGFQVLNLFWILSTNRKYKRLGEQARANGEPLREPARQKIEQVKQLTRVTRADGSVGYEAFRWNASAWFGSSLGSICWMLPLSAIVLWHGSFMVGGIVGICFVTGLVFAFGLWRVRNRINAYRAFQLLVWFVFALALIVFSVEQFLADPATQAASQWTAWGWLCLLIFPLLSLQFFWIRRRFEKEMLNRHSSDL
jgi:RNA polymerase sigma factor (sigma-70 family)